MCLVLFLLIVEKREIDNCLWHFQEAAKEAELAKQKKAEKAEMKKRTKGKAVQAKPAPQKKQPQQTEIRPYVRSRSIGPTSDQDSSMDQSETRAPADGDQSGLSNVSSPAVYVRGQKRKVSKYFVLFLK